MHTKKELVGPAGSSFTRWAAYLSNATSVRLYSLPENDKDYAFGWTNPSLVHKFKFEYFGGAESIRPEPTED